MLWRAGRQSITLRLPSSGQAFPYQIFQQLLGIGIRTLYSYTVHRMPGVCPIVHARLCLSVKEEFPMRGKSLPEMISQFVFYKKANGYQYQTGAYYLKKYLRFVIETAPETVTPDQSPVPGLRGLLPEQGGPSIRRKLAAAKLPAFLVCRFAGKERFWCQHTRV